MPPARAASRGRRAAYDSVGRECNFDIKTTAGTRAGGDRGSVGCENRTDDCEAEPMPGALAHTFGADLLERLEQSVNILGSNHRSGIADGETRTSSDGPGRNFDAAPGEAVAQRVVYEVCHQALDQSRVTDHLHFHKVGFNMKASALSFF